MVSEPFILGRIRERKVYRIAKKVKRGRGNGVATEVVDMKCIKI